MGQYQIKTPKRFYHCSRASLDLGLRLVPRRKKTDLLGTDMKNIESIIEWVRERKFSLRPSRMNCVYLRNSLEDSSPWEIERSKVYEVEVVGDAFVTDTKGFETIVNLYYELKMNPSDKKCRRIFLGEVLDYWASNKEERSFQKEILLAGDVRIVRKLTPSEIKQVLGLFEIKV